MEPKLNIREWLQELHGRQKEDNEFCNTREFEVIIKNISDYPEIEHEIKQYQTSPDYQQDDFMDFCLYFILFTRYRRDDRLRDLDNLYHESGRYRYPIYSHIELLYKAATKEQITLKLVNDAEKLLANNTLSNNIGVIHHFCLLVAEYYESVRTDEIDRAFDNRADDRSDSQKRDIDNALENMKIVLLKNRDYAKFHSTNGRLLALSGDFDQALMEMSAAIRLEIGNDQQRSARIATYKIQKSAIEMMKVMAKINESSAKFFEETRALQKETQDIKVNNIKFLSIFTAILAFLTSGLAIFNETFSTGKLFVLLLAVFALFMILFGMVFLVFSLINKEKLGANIDNIESAMHKKEIEIANLKVEIVTADELMSSDINDSISNIEKELLRQDVELKHAKKRVKSYNLRNVLPAALIVFIGVIMTITMAILVFNGLV